MKQNWCATEFFIRKALFDHNGKKVNISKSQYEVTYKEFD